MHKLGCLNKLPPTQARYFSQQYRWTYSHMQLPFKIIRDIVRLWFHLITYLHLMIIIPLSVWQSTTDTYRNFSTFFTMITFTGNSNAVSIDNGCATLARIFNYEET